MTDQEKGIRLGLKLALEIEKSLRKSPAEFSVYFEYKGYKDGVTIYRDRIQALYNKHWQGGLTDLPDP
jgi:hypothetical protein